MLGRAQRVLPIGLGLGAAASIGVGNVAVGYVTRRLSPLVVGFWTQAAGGVLCAILILLLQPPLIAGQVPWGLIDGLAGGCGTALFYRAMAAGAISLVAPITACSIVIPVAFALAAGEVVTPLVAAGIVAIISGVVIASMQPMPVVGDPTDTGLAGDRRAVMFAIGAAFAYGAFFVLIGNAPEASGLGALWTAGSVRVTGFGVQAALLLLSRTPLTTPGKFAPLVLLSGSLDLLSLILISLGAATDAYGLVTALVGIYPVISAAVSVALLGERLTRIQTSGAVLAMAGVMLVSV
jgi:drug/metabolite transporter (DMT)-like permease